MRGLRPLPLLLALLTASALAGGRPRYGGRLQVALVGEAESTDPLLATAPAEAARLLLTHQPLCRVAALSRPAPGVVRLTLPPGLAPARVAAALARVQAAPGPPHALLAPVAKWTSGEHHLELHLRAPAVEVERLLCHPAFAVDLGPFVARGAALEANDAFPAGRPYLDAVAVQAADARAAARLFAQRRAHLVLGSDAPTGAPQRFATALVLGDAADAHLRAAVEATASRDDLARFFVPAPAAPLTTLTPTAAAPAALPAPARPPPLTAPREVALHFDAQADHERALAQRLQVKLQPLGYRVALRPLPRAALLTRTPAAGELQVVSLLLPETALGALLLWMSAAGEDARLPALLQQPELEARAPGLARALPVVPLVTRGLGVSASSEVQQLTYDASGLPRLDDVFLAPE